MPWAEAARGVEGGARVAKPPRVVWGEGYLLGTRAGLELAPLQAGGGCVWQAAAVVNVRKVLQGCPGRRWVAVTVALGEVGTLGTRHVRAGWTGRCGEDAIS